MLTQEKAHSLFKYTDGMLYWKIRPKYSRKPKGDMEAGTKSGHGYKKITFNKKRYYVHQLMYLMHYGFIPKLIDHIDGNKSNNNIENLREATKSQNACNSNMNINNSSGYKGVAWHKTAKKWVVQLIVNDKQKYFGCYDDIELADLVAQEGRNKYYGEFARHF
jgi:hypothetical protein